MKGENFLAFLGGALVGGVIALLYAPDSGRRTRERIKDFVEDEVDEVKDFMHDSVDKAKHAVEKGKREVNRRINEARDAVDMEMAEVRAAVCEFEEEHMPRRK